tara:strand:+ start:1584 stop:3443 length:1860 start_codon:yes stop_codon:yes gene_type:complete
MQTQNIPKELIAHDKWVNFRFENRGGDKPTKVPYQPNNVRARVDDPSTWHSFIDCVEGYEARKFDGIGYVLTKEDGYTIIDLDHVRNPDTKKLDQLASDIIGDFASYTEVSVSGTGVHIVVKGKLPEGRRRKDQVEAYDQDRYIIFTGDCLVKRPIEDCQEELKKFHQKYLGKTKVDPMLPSSAMVVLSDEAVLDKAFNARNGALVKNLYGGDITSHSSASEADLALAGLIAFYSNDSNQVERLMRSSKLNRVKWDVHPTYLLNTVNRAITTKSESYDDFRSEQEEIPSEWSLDRIRSLFKTDQQLIAETSEQVEWIVPNYIAVGAITEIDGPMKTAGKTTFITSMCKAVTTGSEFLDQQTLQTPVVYLTEEHGQTFKEALTRARIDQGLVHIFKFGDSLIHNVSWPQAVDFAFVMAQHVGAKLIIVDTLPSWLRIRGDGENQSGAALEAMEPLLALRSKGMGILIIRHERKGGGDIGESARGSTAFGGSIDVICTLRKADGNSPYSVRVLSAVGRFNDIPAKTMIDYRDGVYVNLGTETQVIKSQGREKIMQVMPDNEGDAMDRDELYEATGVTKGTGQEIITELVEQGLITQTGKGVKNNKFRYWINRLEGTSVPTD